MGKDKILLGLNYGLASYSTVTNKFNNYDWQDRSFVQRDLPNRVSAVLPLDSGVFLTNSIFSSVKKVDLINNRIDTMAWGSDSRALLMDKNDKIWLADARRVYRINSSSSQIDTIRNEENGQSFIDGVIYNIHLDSHHERVWVASFLGLGFIDINSLKVTPVLADDALLGATVYDVIQDKMGNYWVITNSHLVAINEKFEIVYNSKLSRMSNSYLGDYASMLLLPDGRIVVSSVGGVLVVDAAKCLETKIPAPETYLYAIVSGDNNFQYGERVDLHFNHSPLLLEFACLSYTHAASNTFYYRLKGLQENWISNDDNASLRFERLSPGEYTLEIVSVNANGIWDNTPLEIHIKVSYPFWQRWWFFVLILFATAIIFYVIYRYRLSQLNKLTLMRNNISRDLHDDLGATLSAINIATALINKQAENPSQIKRIVAGMRKDIAHASEALDDIVWSINPKNDDWKILIARMRRYAAEILENAGIRYVIDFAEDVPQTRLSLESRRDIYLIFKETINNAARHSGAKFVQIGFSKEHENWVLKIKDDGKGFDVESSSERNGLKNIKYRCERINAAYELASSPDGGTSWIFRF
jgi:two-component sensor histidine kinase